MLRPGGRFALQARCNRHPFQIDPARLALPGSFARYFDMSDVVTTHLAEHAEGRAVIAVAMGRRKREPTARRSQPSLCQM